MSSDVAAEVAIVESTHARAHASKGRWAEITDLRKGRWGIPRGSLRSRGSVSQQHSLLSCMLPCVSRGSTHVAPSLASARVSAVHHPLHLCRARTRAELQELCSRAESKRDLHPYLRPSCVRVSLRINRIHGGLHLSTRRGALTATPSSGAGVGQRSGIAFADG